MTSYAHSLARFKEADPVSRGPMGSLRYERFFMISESFVARSMICLSSAAAASGERAASWAGMGATNAMANESETNRTKDMAAGSVEVFRGRRTLLLFTNGGRRRQQGSAG